MGIEALAVTRATAALSKLGSLLAALAVTLLPTLAWAEQDRDVLPSSAAGILKKSGVPAHRVGLYVGTLDGDILVAHNLDNDFNPASAIKLVVAMAALDILGPEFVWQTQLLSEAKVVDGTLQGDLYLRGSGDPTLSPERLLALVAVLRTRGIRAIAGDIVIDGSLFKIESHNPSSFDGAGTRPYNGSAGAAIVGFGVSKIVIRSQGAKVIAFSEPPSTTFKVIPQIKSRRASCSRNWRGRLQELLKRDAASGTTTLRLRGSFPTGCSEQAFYLLAQDDPEVHLAGSLRGYFELLGGKIAGSWRSAQTPAGARVLAKSKSRPLFDALRMMNKHSNNIMARNIFLMLAKATGEPPYTTARARQALTDWFSGIGVEAAGMHVDNGSGLSRDSRISPRQFAAAMNYFVTHPYFPELVATMPILGVDGTVRKWLRRSKAAGDAHVKTGTLAGVRTLVGYVHPEDGRQLLFVAMIDWRNTWASRRVLQELLTWAHSQATRS